MRTRFQRGPRVDRPLLPFLCAEHATVTVRVSGDQPLWKPLRLS